MKRPLSVLCLTLLLTVPAAAQGATDPRIGLRAGLADAGVAAWNMRLVSNTPVPDSLSKPGDFMYMNSDLAFRGTTVVQGNFRGIQVWDVADPARPRLVSALICPEMQNDVSVYRNLLFVSSEDPNGRRDCGTQGIQDSVSAERVRGIRIFDISDLARPRQITIVQTCRGSHTHTILTSPADTANVYVYVSGSAPVRSPSELPGCSAAPPERDPGSALFRIEVIRVPLAHPEQAAIVSSPRIFEGLTRPPEHGPTEAERAEQARQLAAARSRGAFTAVVNGVEEIAPGGFVRPYLDSIVRARGGSGAPTAADSAALRGAFQGIVDRLLAGQDQSNRGPSQCHDITVYPAINRAGGACGGYGLLLDITDPANPRRIDAAADSNFSYWHSATFNNDGTKVLFSDEWGGGLQPRCRATDPAMWGANAIFTIAGDRMTYRSYFKIPAPQTVNENCVSHNGSLVPVPGRDIMVQGFYQGGVTVFDWTDAANPVEIAFFDRGPVDSTRLVGAGSWSAYWYNGHIYSSEIARGLDIMELTPSAHLTMNEIEAAKTARLDVLNVQNQPRYTWPASFVVARAYLDQLERGNGVPQGRITSARQALDRAERQRGAAQRTALDRLAGELERQSAVTDTTRMRALIEVLRQIGR